MGVLSSCKQAIVRKWDLFCLRLLGILNQTLNNSWVQGLSFGVEALGFLGFIVLDLGMGVSGLGARCQVLESGLKIYEHGVRSMSNEFTVYWAVCVVFGYLCLRLQVDES